MERGESSAEEGSSASSHLRGTAMWLARRLRPRLTATRCCFVSWDAKATAGETARTCVLTSG